MEWSSAWKFGGITNLYRDLIRLRRNLSGTTRGLQGQNTNIFQVDNNAKIIAFHRWSEEGLVTTLSSSSTSATEATQTSLSAFHGMACGGSAFIATGQATTPISAIGSATTPKRDHPA